VAGVQAARPSRAAAMVLSICRVTRCRAARMGAGRRSAGRYWCGRSARSARCRAAGPGRKKPGSSRRGRRVARSSRHGGSIIERIPHSRAYQVSEDGPTIALFLTRLTQRLLIPGLAQLTSPGPPGRSRLRQADRAYRDALTDLARRASLAALRHLQLSPAVITSLSSAVTPAHAAT